jgi:hypothetical protein
MIDRIMYISTKEIQIIFSDRPPFTVYSNEGDVLRLATWLLNLQLINEVTEPCITLKTV